jgi:hypothetical protein
MKHRVIVIIAVMLSLLLISSLTYAKVEYLPKLKDTKTKGTWIDKYGKNGAILFAPKDLADLKDIANYDVGGSLKWDWANPTADTRGLQYPNDPNKRAGSCTYDNPVRVITVETKLTAYQVGIYFCDWDSSVRSEDVVGYSGKDKPPANADVTISNPEFHDGIWHFWNVTEKDVFKLQVTFKSGANWVIGGLFVDAVKVAVEPIGKLATTWASVKDTN